MKIEKLIHVLVSIPKTIYTNFKMLPINIAFKLPLLVSNNVKLGETTGKIFIEADRISPFMIRIGLEGSQGVVSQKGYMSVSSKGTILFKGKASIAQGTSLRVDNGVLEFGNNFSSNKNCFFSCSCGIKFGDNVLMGFNIAVRDSDGHTIIENGAPKPNLLPIEIGSHVWICSEVDILKGSIIGDDSIVAYRSCVINPCKESNVLIGGYPAKILKTGITWKE